MEGSEAHNIQEIVGAAEETAVVDPLPDQRAMVEFIQQTEITLPSAAQCKISINHFPDIINVLPHIII